MSKLDLDKIRADPKSADWRNISRSDELTEELMDEFRKYLDWSYISHCVRLSESAIEKFKDNVNWRNVAIYQKLSEDFIQKLAGFLSSEQFNISAYQKLSEGFIRKFRTKVAMPYVCTYQILSEQFIREFKDWLDLSIVAKYQKLSEEFRDEFNLSVPPHSWMYKSDKWKEQYIRENTDYEIVDGEVIAYKSCRKDGYSAFNFQYRYEIGEEYESSADYNADHDNSFGLSAWTFEGACRYYKKGKVFKVGIKLSDVACIVHNGEKIRATKIRIIEEVEK